MASTRKPHKVILLGKNNVGKASLFQQLIDNTFDENGTKPIPNYCVKEITVEGETVQMELHFPEPGMYHQHISTRSYYTDAVVALLVYNANDVESIKKLGDIVTEMRNNCNAKLILIRNKIDLDDIVTPEEALSHLTSNGHSKNIVRLTLDTSAKSNIGIDRLRQEIGKTLLAAENLDRTDIIRLY